QECEKNDPVHGYLLARVRRWASPNPYGDPGSGLPTDRNPEALRRAANFFRPRLLDQFVTPAESAVIQPANRPLQGHRDNDFRFPDGIRHPTQQAGIFLHAEPGGALADDEPRLLDVPEALGRRALQGSHAQVAQRADNRDRILELRPDPGGRRRLAGDERSSSGSVVRRPAPLSFGI